MKNKNVINTNIITNVIHFRYILLSVYLYFIYVYKYTNIKF